MINGPINETFVLNCPKCASHFKSSQLLEQHLKVEHNVSNYIGGFNTEDSLKGKIDSDMGMNVEDDGPPHYHSILTPGVVDFFFLYLMWWTFCDFFN